MASEPLSMSLRKADRLFGVARIDLDKLRFDDAIPNGHRDKSKKIQAKLLNVFELEGCQRMEQEHFVDALITRECLSEALVSHGKSLETFRESCNISHGSLRDVIWLKPFESLRCMNGLHRIAAAKRFLDKNDRWWTVRLYEKQYFEADLTTHIQEAFGHEQHYSDGAIFHNIRRYHRLADEGNENKWWARLTASKKRDLKQLLKDKQFVNAFDSLIDLPGLWPPIQLGTLHRQHGLRCTEEMISYLEHVRHVWHTMIPTDCREFLDEYTAQQLEMLAPAMSRSDSEKVKDLFTRRQVFSALTDPSRRDLLLRAILNQQCLIPTLRTFFENQKYLEPCSIILKTLLDDTDKRSLWQSFRANFFQPDSLRVQLSDNLDGLKVLSTASSDQQGVALRLGYVQLWMFCFRHFPEMTRIKPRLEARNGQQASQRPINPSLIPRLARLAVKLGFQTDKAVTLASKDPERLAAEEFIRSARPSHEEDISDHALAIKRILAAISESSLTTSGPECFEFIASQSLLRERRCGRPFERDHNQERRALFAPLVYYDVEPGIEFTSLYAKTDTIKSFFSHCIPVDDTVARNLLGAWAQVPEQDTVTDGPVERPRIIEPVNMSQLRDDLEHCNEMRSRETDQIKALAEQLAQARDELRSAQGACSLCDNQTLLERELDSLRQNLQSSHKNIVDKEEMVAKKDRAIKKIEKELQDLKKENVDLMSQTDVPLEDHHNGNIESDYSELVQAYMQLQDSDAKLRAEIKALQVDKATMHDELRQEHNASRDETIRQNTALQEDLGRLRDEIRNLQSQAQNTEASHAEALNGKSIRIRELERQQTGCATNLVETQEKLNKAIRLRHRTVDFPLRPCESREAHSRFESDVHYMVGQHVNEDVSSDYLRVCEIVYDEENLGFMSRVFHIRKEGNHIKEFIDWLKERKPRCSSQPFVFDFCIQHEEGRVQFQRIMEIGQDANATDADAQALVAVSARNAEIFYGLQKDDSDLFRRKLRSAGGLSVYNKRKHEEIHNEHPEAVKRRALNFDSMPDVGTIGKSMDLTLAGETVAGDPQARPPSEETELAAALERDNASQDTRARIWSSHNAGSNASNTTNESPL